MRIINFDAPGAIHRETGETYTLSYEAILPGGEVVRFVRTLPATGVETLGRALTSIDFDDPRRPRDSGSP